MYELKYIKYKNKYLDLKNKLKLDSIKLRGGYAYINESGHLYSGSGALLFTILNNEITFILFLDYDNTYNDLGGKLEKTDNIKDENPLWNRTVIEAREESAGLIDISELKENGIRYVDHKSYRSYILNIELQSDKNKYNIIKDYLNNRKIYGTKCSKYPRYCETSNIRFMYEKDFVDEYNSKDIDGEKITINNRCYNIIKKLINKKI